ncbi:aminoacyl-tRNA hydrolase [Helicobacter sp. MIT 21-1697]|uniref:aminoacyl-tRNA hydrolase n=1 Tax=Helicobacter sp. MIT 21-1697 TaxID=2993733 RepID=UPI00224AD1BB|nr:aminoacyl-tRNA hydrolase [Helicobacter sp. MIT 21-1697]MCX2717504.1 aminoacyl-tRNA hydrolase [Helicobacter sp. MIT 21-1697]
MSCLLVAGLGNPSAKYQNTRHNVGFMVLDFLSKELGFDFSLDKKFNAEVGVVKIDSHKVFFLKPQTFMNLSGEAIAPFVRYFDITHTFVIHDDIDIGFGNIRFKYGGSSGGHNGLKSIDSHMGDTYFRLRFGVGRGVDKNVVEYVLSDFNIQEREQLDRLITHAKQAVMSFCNMAQYPKEHILAYLQQHFTLKMSQSTAPQAQNTQSSVAQSSQMQHTRFTQG